MNEGLWGEGSAFETVYSLAWPRIPQQSASLGMNHRTLLRLLKPFIYIFSKNSLCYCFMG